MGREERQKGRSKCRPQFLYALHKKNNVKKLIGLKIHRNHFYFFSTFSRWTENFGVVPLFLLSAFLFAPIFFSLFLLLLRVTAVFETIFYLLSYHNRTWGYHLLFTSLPNLSYLPTDKLNVKILILSLGLLLPLQSPWAVILPLKEKRNILISKGEYKEIPIDHIQNFTVGNKEIISHKVSNVLGKILIKGKKLGFSELVIWDSKGKRTYQIYVLSKKRHLKILHIAQTLQSLGLKTKLIGPLILAQGIVRNYPDYLLLHKIHKKYSDSFFFKGHLGLQLKSLLLKKVKAALPLKDGHGLNCSEESYSLTCFYSHDIKLTKEAKNLIIRRYKVTLIPKENASPKNYILKIKLMKLEKQDGKEFGAGLEGLSGSFLDLYKKDLKSFLLQNKFFFKGNKLNLQILAEPQSIIQIRAPLKIKIGDEIPIQKMRSPKDLHLLPQLQWKFSGLGLKLLLTPKGKDFLLKFDLKFSSLSSGNGQSFTGGQESSSATLTLEKPLHLFEIGLKTIKKETNFFPWLEDIPILGFFFKNESTSIHYKKISAFVLLKRLK